MSGIPDAEIVRSYGMVPLDKPLTGYEVRGWWDGTLFMLAELSDNWRDAQAVWWMTVDVLRKTKPPDVRVTLTMIAVTGSYPAPSWTVATTPL